MFTWVENLAARQLAALVRHLLTGVAGSLVAKGLMNGDQGNAIIGGIMAFTAVTWSLVQKHQVAEAVAAIKAGATDPLQAQAAPPDDLEGLH